MSAQDVLDQLAKIKGIESAGGRLEDAIRAAERDSDQQALQRLQQEKTQLMDQMRIEIAALVDKHVTSQRQDSNYKDTAVGRRVQQRIDKIRRTRSPDPLDREIKTIVEQAEKSALAKLQQAGAKPQALKANEMRFDFKADGNPPRIDVAGDVAKLEEFLQNSPKYKDKLRIEVTKEGKKIFHLDVPPHQLAEVAREAKDHIAKSGTTKIVDWDQKKADDFTMAMKKSTPAPAKPQQSQPQQAASASPTATPTAPMQPATTPSPSFRPGGR